MLLPGGLDGGENDLLARNGLDVLTADAPVFVVWATTGDDLAGLNPNAVDVPGFIVGFVPDVDVGAIVTDGELELLVLGAFFVDAFFRLRWFR